MTDFQYFTANRMSLLLPLSSNGWTVSDPHPHPHYIKIRIRIKIYKLDPEPDPDPHQFADFKPKCMEYYNLLLAKLCCKAVLWNRNYFLRFRFRFRLLNSYGSGSDFRKSYGSGSGSGSYFRKVTFPVPVPAPYLDHKKLIF